MTIGVLFGKMKFFAERPHKLKSGAKNKKFFCEILLLKHSAAQGPWIKKRDGTIVYHDITELYTSLSVH